MRVAVSITSSNPAIFRTTGCCVQYSSGRTRGAEMVGFAVWVPPQVLLDTRQHNPPREAGRRRRWLEFTGRAVDSRPAHSHAPTYTVVTQPTLFAMMHHAPGPIMHQPTQQCGGTSETNRAGTSEPIFTVPCYLFTSKIKHFLPPSSSKQLADEWRQWQREYEG